MFPKKRVAVQGRLAETGPSIGTYSLETVSRNWVQLSFPNKLGY